MHTTMARKSRVTKPENVGPFRAVSRITARQLGDRGEESSYFIYNDKYLGLFIRRDGCKITLARITNPWKEESPEYGSIAELTPEGPLWLAERDPRFPTAEQFRELGLIYGDGIDDVLLAAAKGQADPVAALEAAREYKAKYEIGESIEGFLKEVTDAVRGLDSGDRHALNDLKNILGRKGILL